MARRVVEIQYGKIVNLKPYSIYLVNFYQIHSIKYSSIVKFSAYVFFNKLSSHLWLCRSFAVARFAAGFIHLESIADNNIKVLLFNLLTSFFEFIFDIIYLIILQLN